LDITRFIQEKTKKDHAGCGGKSIVGERGCPIMEEFKSLFSALTVGDLLLKNRITLPAGALVYALVSESLLIFNYVHIMAGALWTGIDLFWGFVLGPILGAMDPKKRTAVFMRLMPRMTFLMPVLAGVTGQQQGFTLRNGWASLR
jgi:hypothetical protein